MVWERKLYYRANKDAAVVPRLNLTTLVAMSPKILFFLVFYVHSRGITIVRDALAVRHTGCAVLSLQPDGQ